MLKMTKNNDPTHKMNDNSSNKMNENYNHSDSEAVVLVPVSIPSTAKATVVTKNDTNTIPNSCNNSQSSPLGIPDSPIVVPPPASWYEHEHEHEHEHEKNEQPQLHDNDTMKAWTQGKKNVVNTNITKDNPIDNKIQHPSMENEHPTSPTNRNFHDNHDIPKTIVNQNNNNHDPEHSCSYTSPLASPTSSPIRRKHQHYSNHNNHYHNRSPKSSSSSISSSLSLSTNTRKKTNHKTKSNNKNNNNKDNNLKEQTKKQLQNTIQSIHTITTSYIPSLTQEILYNTTRNIFHYTQKSYNQSLLFGKLQLKFSDLGNKNGGYDYESLCKFGIVDERDGSVLWNMGHIQSKYYYHFYFHDLNNYHDDVVDSSHHNHHKMMVHKKQTSGNGSNNHNHHSNLPMGYGWEDEWDRQRIALPPFSSLDWVDRQLVKEWRTCDYMITRQQQQEQQQQEQQQQEQQQLEQQQQQKHKDFTDIESNNDHESFKSSQETNTEGGHDDDCIINNSNGCTNNVDNDEIDEHGYDNDNEADFIHARTFLPKPMPRPPWENATSCYTCRKVFNTTRLRHHCRLCGRSYCNDHSNHTHRLPHLGYDPDVPERTCGQCKHFLNLQSLAERIAWRMARCRDFLVSPMDLFPYFETGIDTVEDAAARLTKAAIHMAKSIPMGAQATVAVETLDVLRKHGLKGVYGLILRKEFMAAADLLCKVTGINKKVWPLSVHELSAAIFYALAQHRALRGIDPEREHRIHSVQSSDNSSCCDSSTVAESICSVPSIEIIDDEKFVQPSSYIQGVDMDKNSQHDNNNDENDDSSENAAGEEAVCEPVSDNLLESLIFYAPVAMNFIYAKNEVDMQLLAAQQGWRLIYAHLTKDGYQVTDMPAFALFVHMEQNICCLTIRGTATINDVVTDIKAMPVQFPDADIFGNSKRNNKYGVDDEEWTEVLKGQGLALCGMAGAAYNLFRENVEALLLFARKGYRIRLVGHSLGGGVASLLGALVRRELIQDLQTNKTNFDNSKQTGKKEVDQPNLKTILRVYSYGSPACVDANLAEFCKSYVVSCVLHDDVIPRLTPTSIRALLKHLLYIRETWVKAHLANDLMAITERAKKAWAPRLRNGFTLMSTQKPSVKMYKKLKAKGSSLKRKVSKCTGLTSTSSKDIKKYDNMTVEDEVPYTNTKFMDNGEIIDSPYEGLLYEGDCFFEADQSLIENSDEDSDSDSKMILSEKKKENECFAALDGKDTENNIKNSSSAVLLEETPLPRMFLPGKVVHIYTHRGGYKLAQVPRAFRELRRISLAGNMITDHMSKSYYEALLECKSVRRAPKQLPRWTGFGEDSTCSCCASLFTWASTSDSEAQEARDKHNCRSCGGLVCDPCSKNRLPLSHIGINSPCRVCDRCYHNMGSVLGDENALTRSFTEDADDKGTIENEEAGATLKGYEATNEKREYKTKSNRSTVVDELILRMPSTTLSS